MSKIPYHQNLRTIIEGLFSDGNTKAEVLQVLADVLERECEVEATERDRRKIAKLSTQLDNLALEAEQEGL